MSVTISIEERLAVFTADIGDDVAARIVGELTIENEEKLDAKRRNLHEWWEMPDEFILAGIEQAVGGEVLTMPRGYLSRLVALLREEHGSVTLIDGRKWKRVEQYEWTGPILRPHQPLAVRKTSAHHHGIYVAPTGSGKTVVVIRTLCELQPERAIIYVNQIDLVDQWIERITQYTSLTEDQIGRIGDGEWSEGCITVATVQSVWSAIKRGEIDREWFERDSYVELDECHGVTAFTFNEVISRHTARHRKGTSATPAKTGDFKLAQATLGPIVHEDDYDELVDQGVLIRPSVEVVDTGFDRVFWGDHRVSRNKKTKRVDYCQVPGCPKSGKIPHGHRNNYQKILGELVRDGKRAHTVAGKVVEHWDRGIQLICSSQTTQLDLMHQVLRLPEYGIDERDIFMLTGRVKGKKRKEMIDEIQRRKNAVVLSTVAGQGLDIPIVSTVHLGFPMGNTDAAKQIIGRALRIAEGKKDALVIDYRDKVSSMAAQFRKRVKKVYVPMGFHMLNYEPETRSGNDDAGLGRGLLNR